MFATVAPPAVNSFELLETMEPGPELATALASVDRDALSSDELVSVLVAHRRLVSHYLAEACRDIAGVADLDGAGQHHVAVENTAAEIGAALCLTRRGAEAETHLALELVRRLPQVLGALGRGDIDLPRAQVLVRGTEHLPLAAARAIVEQIIDDAAGLTTGQLTARLRRLCLEFDPDSARDWYQRSVEDRRVYVTPNPEGTANLHGLDLPPDRVTAISRYLDKAARRLRRNGDERSMDQLRADLFLDILQGDRDPTSGAFPGGVHIGIAATTLAGLDDQPGEIPGFGPVLADVARQVADNQHQTQWIFTVTDPATGDIVHTGTTRRRPTTPQRRRIEARYPTCVWPGCRMPSVDCDIDHNHPYGEGGCTHDHNLAPICRHHHRIRHQAGWHYQRLNNGDHHWTSPLGRTYTTSGRSP
jgi:hypothetical protein